jgi:hypothetical protein
MKAAVGSRVMFYVSKNQDASAEWNLKRVYLIVGEGEDAAEYEYDADDTGGFIAKNGDAYSFLMPDAPVTIAAEAQKTPGRIIAETYVEIDGREVPYTNHQSDVGNLQAYKHNGSGSMDLLTFSNMEKTDTAFIGEQVFIAAYPMWGGRLKSITVEQEGYAPFPLTPMRYNGESPYNQHLCADVYSFPAMRGTSYKVRAVYATDDVATVKIQGCESDASLEFSGERQRTLMFSRVYAQSSARRSTAVTQI